MATENTATWSLGESVIWYTPNLALDPIWSLGESIILDEYVAAGGGSAIPLLVDFLGGDGSRMGNMR
jgi:hypothetical protein